MQKFIGKRRKVYLTFSKEISMGQAILKANESFKTSLRNLYVAEGAIIGDKLYMSFTEGDYPKGKKEMVWVVFTKGVK